MWIPPVAVTKKGTKDSRERDTAVVSGWSIFQSLPFRWQLERAAGLVPVFGTGVAMRLCPLLAKRHQSTHWTWKLPVEPPRSWGRQWRFGQLLRGVWMLAEQSGGCCGVTVSTLTLFFSRVRGVEGLSNHRLSILHLFSRSHKGKSLQEWFIWILVWGYGTVSVTQWTCPSRWHNTCVCSPASGCCVLCLFLWWASSSHIYLCSFLALQPTTCNSSLPKQFSP